MAENSNGGADAAPAPAAGQGQAQAQPSLKIVSQYVKDLSFENPGAPQTLMSRSEQPNINISVGVGTKALTETDVEVELRLEAKATAGEKVMFAAELVYAGIFRLENIPKDNLQALTLIECPRLLFPFARQIVAEASRNGGFPPLMIDPIDFVALFRQQAQKAAAASQGSDPGAAPPPATN